MSHGDGVLLVVVLAVFLVVVRIYGAVEPFLLPIAAAFIVGYVGRGSLRRLAVRGLRLLRGRIAAYRHRPEAGK